MKGVVSSGRGRNAGPVALGLVLLVSAGSGTKAGLIGTPASTATTFRVYELAFSADVPGSNPYLNGPSLTAIFTGTSGAASGKVLTIKGFWDGDNVWRVRFAPTAQGDWSWTTSSNDAGMNGFSGSLTVIGPTPEELAASVLYRGFLQRDDHAWKLSDGTPFLAVGDTQWSFAEENTTAEWQQWMNARQAQKFNTFLGCIWLAIYTRSGVPDAFPGKNPQTETPNMAYFQRLDQMVQYANDRGIMMGLTIGGFPDNSNWWVKFGTLDRNSRWFRYCVARYTAYNVRWCLYGEVNERNTPWGSTWQQQVAHDAQLVRDEDPYDHPIGSHHTSVDTSSASSPNIDYIEVQIARTETQYQSALNYRQYGKPVWFEEYWYEPAIYDNDVVLGIRNTHRNFVAAMAYPTMGSLMRAHYPDFSINDVWTDPGAVRMSFFWSFYKDLVFLSFSPASGLVNRGQCGRFGNDYAIFLQGGGSVTLNLTGVFGSFDVTRLDINTGATAGLGTIAGDGQRTINSGTTSDVAIRLVKFPGPNQPPIVSAGDDQVVHLSQGVILDGTVSDDGQPDPPGIMTTVWSQVDGPGVVTFADVASVDTTAGFSQAGVYTLRLTADDGSLSASDETVITVNGGGGCDFDGDTDVDQVDFAHLQVCATGSGQAVANPACFNAILDGDEDIDQNDFAVFVGCVSGPDLPATAECRGE